MKLVNHHQIHLLITCPGHYRNAPLMVLILLITILRLVHYCDSPRLDRVSQWFCALLLLPVADDSQRFKGKLAHPPKRLEDVSNRNSSRFQWFIIQLKISVHVWPVNWSPHYLINRQFLRDQAARVIYLEEETPSLWPIWQFRYVTSSHISSESKYLSLVDVSVPERITSSQDEQLRIEGTLVNRLLFLVSRIQLLCNGLGAGFHLWSVFKTCWSSPKGSIPARMAHFRHPFAESLRSQAAQLCRCVEHDRVCLSLC
jgi:hypothetical protein